jgi:hypothetical protein
MQDSPPPLWLLHKPIFMLPYAPFDGPYRDDTDAKYLSVGLAQWRGDGDPDPVSAKVWRHSGNKWSRQSEELPLHRLVDLCIFMVESLYGASPVGETLVVEPGTFEHQSETIELRRMESLPAGFADQSPLVKARLRKLRDVLAVTNLD